MGTTTAYTAKLDALVDLITGHELVEGNGIDEDMVAKQAAECLAVRNLPWVKQLAAGMAAKVQAAKVMVDINFPIQKKAKKFQKSINERRMAGKIEEGT